MGQRHAVLLTGEEFGAEHAHRIGLVQEVVPVGAQHERATEIADRIATQAPLGVQATLVRRASHATTAPTPPWPTSGRTSR